MSYVYGTNVNIENDVENQRASAIRARPGVRATAAEFATYVAADKSASTVDNQRDQHTRDEFNGAGTRRRRRIDVYNHTDSSDDIVLIQQ